MGLEVIHLYDFNLYNLYAAPRMWLSSSHNEQRSEKVIMPVTAPIGDDDVAAYTAIETIYHAYLTGLILALVTRAGPRQAAEIVFRTFRRQQLARFLPGLKKLGLHGLPHAVACAQYHYLSNQVGGVKVEYVYENDSKAWIRYPPPRWIWRGTAVCGIPSEISRAMLLGWHANNGVVLGNPRLGFVCTSQTVDGQPGLEGYYKEWGYDLAPDERLQFSPGEECPPFVPKRHHACRPIHGRRHGCGRCCGTIPWNISRP